VAFVREPPDLRELVVRRNQPEGLVVGVSVIRRRLSVSLGILLVLASGCDREHQPIDRAAVPGGSTVVETPSSPTRGTGHDPGCLPAPGSETDLAKEPGYTANYLYRFRDGQGCQVRLDVMMYRNPGPDHHCAPWPPEIVLVNPVGISFAPTSTTLQPTYIDARIYVRDPDGTWKDSSLPMGFDSNVSLPGDARDTGYVSDAGRLFVVPHDDRFVYVVTKTGTERWPREKLTGCV
jgi:hypothetical protein